MKFINVAVVRFSVFLTLGILLAHFFPSFSRYLIFLSLFCFGMLVVLWWRGRKQLIPTVFFGIATYVCFLLIGYVNYQLRQPNAQPRHYSHVASLDTTALFTLKVTAILKPDRYNQKYIAEVTGYNNRHTSGKVLLSVKKDSTGTKFTIDDLLLVHAALSETPGSLNPFQFDYAAYLRTLKVHHQFRIDSEAIVKRSKGDWSFRGSAESIRAHIISKLKQTSIGVEERSILQALVLGERNEIDPQRYKAYAAAGAIHILAVSGLHVGILFLLLSQLLYPLCRLPHGALVRSILIVLLLWGFALIAGASPSVVRAVSMFSFFTFAQASRRPTNSINTLLLSYMVLLLLEPLWLFHVGFQLSYLAVFFILWVQPFLFRLVHCKNIIAKKLWGIITVTLSAQLGILPLSLYYFHQFPGLFLLTNIVILPFLALLLAGGIVVIVWTLIDEVPKLVAEGYATAIETLNAFVDWVAGKEDLLFSNIPFSETQVLAAYVLIIVCILLLKKWNGKRVIKALAGILLFICVLFWEKHRASQQQLIVFQKNRHSVIAYSNASEMVLYTEDTSQGISSTFPVSNYRVGRRIDSVSEAMIPKLFVFRKQKILVVDSLGVYGVQDRIDIVILTQSPKLHLDRLIDSLRPDLIIADGSNYTSYVNRWKATCQKRKLPFYHTGARGAFILE